MTLHRSIVTLLALTAACGPGTSTDTSTDDTGDTGSTDIEIGSDGYVVDNCAVPQFDCSNSGYVSIAASANDPIVYNIRLTKDTAWVLDGGVFFGDDESEYLLEIEPGTTVYGSQAADGFLVIQRGSKILAEGTASEPIVFTTDAEEGSRGPSSWGGLVINGRAPTNTCPETGDCDLPGEAGTGMYGGDQPADSSGVLKYVRVEFAGTLVNDQNELNGVAFQGVGSGTEVDYLHAHRCADDGVEFFGGTVNVKHLASTGAGDDGIDWTDGYTGSIQYALVQFHGDQGDNGFENDNNGDDNTAEPRSAAKVQNATVIGNVDSSDDPANDIGMLLREGLAGKYNKFVVVGFGDACAALDQEETYLNAWTSGDYNGDFAVTNSWFYCPDASFDFADASCDFADMDDPAPEWCPGDQGGMNEMDIPFTADDFFTDGDAGNSTADPMLNAAYQNQTAPNFLPQNGSPVLSASGGDLSGMDATDYAGAFKDTNWLSWTEFPAN